MNAAQIHLAFNHLPVSGALFGMTVLAAGLALKIRSVRVTGLAILLAAGLFSFPAYFSGEGAEEMIEHSPGVTEEAIHEHEEAAEKTFVGLIILGVAAGAGLFLERRASGAPQACLFGILFLALVILVMAGWTSHLGGVIRHPEIG